MARACRLRMKRTCGPLIKRYERTGLGDCVALPLYYRDFIDSKISMILESFT
jgi:hypothetical protein